MRFLTRLLGLSCLALAVTGCDFATNETGGAWLSSQHGLQTPRLYQYTVPVSFDADSSVLVSLSAQAEAGCWKSPDGVYDTVSWMVGYSLDSASGVLSDSANSDSLKLHLGIHRPTRLAETAVEVRYGLVSDSATFVNLFSAARPGYTVLAMDTLTVATADTGDTVIYNVPQAVKDTLHKLHKARLVVDFHHVGLSEIVRFKTAYLKTSASDSNTASYSKGHVHAHEPLKGVTAVQGGPAAWALHLFPNRARLLEELSAQGFTGSAGATAVMDAELVLPVADTVRRDSVGQYVSVSSVVDTATDTITLSVSGHDTLHILPQTTDTAYVWLDTAIRTVDSSALILRFYKYSDGSVAQEDSLVLTRDDSLWQVYTPDALNYRFHIRRTGDSVTLLCRGIASALTASSQLGSSGTVNTSARFGSKLGLATTYPFSALLNWEKRPELILSPATTAGDATQWWYMIPKLSGATVRLTLLVLGGR